jgi:hypothetical protein
MSSHRSCHQPAAGTFSPIPASLLRTPTAVPSASALTGQVAIASGDKGASGSGAVDHLELLVRLLFATEPKQLQGFFAACMVQ